MALSCINNMKRKTISSSELEKKMIETKDRLFNFIYRMVLQREISEEIFQETWFRVFKNIDSYDCSRPFNVWLFRIARNLSINHLKMVKNREKKKELLLIEHNLDHNKKEEIILPQEEEKLIECLRKMQPEFREVIHLRFFEEMNLADISNILKLPVGTVKSRTNRGIKHLRRLWEAKE